jgi:hypothetical protein
VYGWAQVDSNHRPLACKAKKTAKSTQLTESNYASELLKLCQRMPGNAWKSMHGGSRKWLPHPSQDRDDQAHRTRSQSHIRTIGTTPPQDRNGHAYGKSMARWGRAADGPFCSACAQDEIRDRSGRIRRAAVRVGICREPYVLRLCEPHLVQLQRVLPEGGVWVVEQYQPGGSDAENPAPQRG